MWVQSQDKECVLKRWRVNWNYSRIAIVVVIYCRRVSLSIFSMLFSLAFKLFEELYFKWIYSTKLVRVSVWLLHWIVFILSSIIYIHSTGLFLSLSPFQVFQTHMFIDSPINIFTTFSVLPKTGTGRILYSAPSFTSMVLISLSISIHFSHFPNASFRRLFDKYLHIFHSSKGRY